MNTRSVLLACFCCLCAASANSESSAPAGNGAVPPWERGVVMLVAEASAAADPTSGFAPENERSRETVNPAIEDVEAGPAGPIQALKVRGLLDKRKFDELNRLLDGLEVGAAADRSTEPALFAAYDTLAIPDPRLEALLDSWTEAFPDRYQPYAARSYYDYRMGWKARGDNWASETTEEQFAGMRAYFGKSLADAVSALQLNESALIPYYVLVGVTSTHGSGEEKEAVIAKALGVHPDSYLLRERYLTALTPRWGGSYDAMARFAEESQAYADANPRLKQLQGLASMDLGDVEWSAGRYHAADEAYTKALSFGENPKVLVKRASNREKLEKHLEALSDIDRAIELSPEVAMSYYYRSRILSALGESLKAGSDIELARQLDPVDEYISERQRRLASALISEGYALGEKHDHVAAMHRMDAAVRLQPQEGNSYYWRARVLIGQNKLDEALADLTVAVALEKGEIDYYLWLDWILAKRKDWDRIIAYWNEFIARNPSNSRAYVERGGAYFHKGDMNAAVADAKIAADMGDPDGKEAYEKFGKPGVMQGKAFFVLRSILASRWGPQLVAAVLLLPLLLWIVGKLVSIRRTRRRMKHSAREPTSAA